VSQYAHGDISPTINKKGKGAKPGTQDVCAKRSEALQYQRMYNNYTQANSAFHPFGVSKWVVIHVITWITGVETINRQTGTVRVVA